MQIQNNLTFSAQKQRPILQTDDVEKSVLIQDDKEILRNFLAENKNSKEANAVANILRLYSKIIGDNKDKELAQEEVIKIFKEKIEHLNEKLLEQDRYWTKKVNELQFQLEEKNQYCQGFQDKEKIYLEREQILEQQLQSKDQDLQSLQEILSDQQNIQSISNKDMEMIEKLKMKVRKLKEQNRVYVEENEAVQSLLDKQQIELRQIVNKKDKSFSIQKVQYRLQKNQKNFSTPQKIVKEEVRFFASNKEQTRDLIYGSKQKSNAKNILSFPAHQILEEKQEEIKMLNNTLDELQKQKNVVQGKICKLPLNVKKIQDINLKNELDNQMLEIEQGISKVKKQLKKYKVTKEKPRQNGIDLAVDQYLVESKLGEGSYGSVYLVLHHNLKKKIALKVIQSSNDEDHIQKLIHELENHYQCDQENIVKCYGYHMENKTLKIAMEYMDFGNLQEIYLFKKQLHQKLLLYIGYKVLSALAYLSSKKILHRDLKPSNILLSSEGDIKLADFGESGNLHETLSYKRTLVGTLLYNSPERVKGDNYYLNCDIWSLGIILLEGSLGRNPMVRQNEKKQDLNYINFVSRVEENFPEVPSEYSSDFKELVGLCLIRDPRKRPSAQELLQLKCMQKQAKVSKESIKKLFVIIKNQMDLQREMRRQSMQKQEEEQNFMRKTNKVWDEYKQLSQILILLIIMQISKNLLQKHQSKLLKGFMPSKNLNKQTLLRYESYQNWCKLQRKSYQTPTLGIIQVGDRRDSQIFIRNKKKVCSQIGFDVKHVQIPEDKKLSIDSISREIISMNQNENINGIVLQLPLPDSHMHHLKDLVNLISPSKDIDCLNFQNYANMLFFNQQVDQQSFPCVSQAIHYFIEEKNIQVKGKNVVIIGSSYLVGFPIQILFEQLNATVTVCNKYTQNLQELTKNADIIVSATGVPNLITKEFLKQESVVFDVGINMKNQKMGGDVDFNDVINKVQYITPVPGGLGSMTVSFMVQNLWRSFLQQNGIEKKLPELIQIHSQLIYFFSSPNIFPSKNQINKKSKINLQQIYNEII